MDHRFLTSGLALALVGCFGGKDDSETDSGSQADPLQADLLIVLDTSASMYDEAGALGLGLDTFARALPSGADLHVAVTTVSADPRDDADGDGSVIEPGEVGTFVGAEVFSSSGDWASDLRRTVLCEGTCWPGECTGSQSDNCVPHDTSYTCGDDPGAVVTVEYLACLCGSGWEPPECGSGNEEGLESAYLALCRASASPPASCIDHTGSPLTAADTGSNPGFLRPDTNTVVLIVSDEGDNSRVLAQGDEDPQDYLTLFREISENLSIAVVGPHWDPEAVTFECNSGGATSWGTHRYQLAAETTGGFFTSIEECTASDGTCSGDDAGYCAVTDFEDVWSPLADLLQAPGEWEGGWW